MTNRRRAILFRVTAVLLGLSPLLALEAGLRLSGYQGRDAAAVDPFVEFDAVRPLFVRQGEALAVPAPRQEYFRPERFPARKPAGQFRIFCLGGSTVQGRPYAIETAFSTWLELSLQAARPERSWDVVNCGGVSYASYRLLPILREVLQYEPDMIVLYCGHNEFLEDRSYDALRRQPAWLLRTAKRLDSLRSFRLARSLLAAGGDRETLSAEVDALLDYRGGLEKYRRDDAWRRAVVEHYELNIRRMIRLCGQAGVPLIVCNPVSNLGDSPPFKSEQGPLGEADAQRFRQLWSAAHPDVTAGLAERIELLEQAVAIDPRHAGGHYQLGKCLQAAGQLGRARRHLVRAKDEDVCPLRMIEPLHAALLSAVEDLGPAWVDVREKFQQQSEGGIVGRRWLVDHVHPSVHGHQQIAQWLLEELQRQGVVTWSDEGRRRREAAYTSHLEGLPAVYYEQGKRRLEGLRRWSEGRAFQVRSP